MTEPSPDMRLALLMDLVREQGARRTTAIAEADYAFARAFDVVQAALEDGEQVNLTRVAELLGVDRGTVYNELRRRDISRSTR
jgi:transcriptional regulator of acetoin/glycerol metabolism